MPAHASPVETAQALLGGVLDDPLHSNRTGSDHLVVGSDEGGTARHLIDQDATVHVRLEDCAWTEGVPVDGHVSITDGGAGDVTTAPVLPFADLSVAPDGSINGVFREQPAG